MTEFTGWPTVSTTPFSIQKLLEQQGAQAIDISEILGRTSTSTTTTTTTTSTTTTTTMRPTVPGRCHGQCDLAGTIKIVDGVKWKPELLDHNTAEWKNLARDIEIQVRDVTIWSDLSRLNVTTNQYYETNSKRVHVNDHFRVDNCCDFLSLFIVSLVQLNNVYSRADRLNKWYKKVRIDSFSKGSVLVDYFVELANIPKDINTQEIKQMFHNALTTVPVSVASGDNATGADPFADEGDEVDEESNFDDSQAKPLKIKESFLMGKFVLDPVATDFIGKRVRRL